MIYLVQTPDAQRVQIPRSDGVASTPWQPFRLRLSRGGRDTVIGDLWDDSDDPKYYDVEVSGTDTLATGEYGYRLEDGAGEVLSEGVAVAGDYVPEVKDRPGEMKTIEYGG